MNTRRLSRTLAALTAVLGMLVSPLAADDLLNAARGEWAGSGVVRSAPDAGVEPLRCRLTNTIAAGVDRLVISGRCATPGQTAVVNGWIEPNGPDTYQGRWTDFFGGGEFSFTGRQMDGQIRTDYLLQDPNLGDAVPGWSVWKVTANALQIETFIRFDGRSASMSRLELAR